jgi:hypothetical protein
MRWSADLAALPATSWFAALVLEETADEWLEDLGVTRAAGLGIIVAKAVDGTARGAGVPGVALAAIAASDGPFYFEGDVPTAAATEYTDDGVAILVNVPPGSHDIVYTAPNGVPCTPRWGWQGAVPSSMETVVVADEVTFVEMDCN